MNSRQRYVFIFEEDRAPLGGSSEGHKRKFWDLLAVKVFMVDLGPAH